MPDQHPRSSAEAWLHRHLPIALILLASAVASAVLLVVRRVYAGKTEYAFLAWNLFLAGIPLGTALVAHFMRTVATNNHVNRLAGTGLLVIWFLFFPNCPYLISDLKHLAFPSLAAPIWFDAILVMSFVFTGLMAGFVSLMLVHDLARRRLGPGWAWAVIAVISISSGYGIYLGRFARLNSWDVLSRPGSLLGITLDRLIEFHPRTIAVTGLYAGFILLGYLTVLAVGRCRIGYNAT